MFLLESSINNGLVNDEKQYKRFDETCCSTLFGEGVRNDRLGTVQRGEAVTHHVDVIENNIVLVIMIFLLDNSIM